MSFAELYLNPTHQRTVTMRTAPTNSDDVIDVRDVIARIETLQETLPKTAEEVLPGTSDEIEEAKAELKTLLAFMDEMKGNGGDEQWLGDWYPITAIRHSYFE